jgi:hypothetical protein
MKFINKFYSAQNLGTIIMKLEKTCALVPLKIATASASKDPAE